MAFAHMAVSFGPTPPQSPTPSMIQFPNPGLCINYFICDNFLGQVMVPDFDSIPIKHVFNMTCYTFWPLVLPRGNSTVLVWVNIIPNFNYVA